MGETVKAARMTRRRACNLVGLPDLEINGPTDIEEFHRKWKFLVSRARESNDDETAKTLSEAWETIKRYGRRYCECGHLKHSTALKCTYCNNGQKQKPTKRIADILGGPVEDGIEVHRWAENGRIRPLLTELDAVGKSRVITAASQSIRTAAKLLNMGIVVIEQKADGKWNGKCRVWRTDGLPMAEVNRIIAERNRASPR